MNLNPLAIKYGYHFRKRTESRSKQRLIRLAKSIRPTPVRGTEDIRLLTFCGEGNVPELLASLTSLGRFAGFPRYCTVVSDGSIISSTADELYLQFPGLKIVDVQSLVENEQIELLLKRWPGNWMVRKLCVLLSMGHHGPSLFVDSDVLFFPGAKTLFGDLGSNGHKFMADLDPSPTHLPSLNPEIIGSENIAMPVLNAGFLYAARPLDWDLGLDRLSRVQPAKHVEFLEQTVAHLVFHQHGAEALDRNRFILTTDDRFSYADVVNSRPAAVCRHYIGTVRHKLWPAAEQVLCHQR